MQWKSWSSTEIRLWFRRGRATAPTAGFQDTQPTSSSEASRRFWNNFENWTSSSWCILHNWPRHSQLLRFKVCRRRKDYEEVVLDLLCLALCFAISILIESEPQWILGWNNVLRKILFPWLPWDQINIGTLTKFHQIAEKIKIGSVNQNTKPKQ